MVTQLEHNVVAGTRPKTVNQGFTFYSLPLQRGGPNTPGTVAYEKRGKLYSAGGKTGLIFPTPTRRSQAPHTQKTRGPKAAWWNPLIGLGRFFDTSRYYVICSNILGGCYGTTGPSSVDPNTGRPYGMRFPVITIRDMVEVQRKLIEHLGVRQLAMVAGGSIGGQQSLEWAVAYPELVRKAIVVAATAALTAQAIAFNEVGRQAILADPRWQGGDYL